MRENRGVDEVLSQRALNRATLARQLLLERAARTPLETVEHLVGMQAQVPHNPYTALWSRLDGFRPESLSELLERREVVRIGVMRGTIHLVTADDCLLLRPLMQPVFEGQLRRHGEHAPALRGVDLEPVVELARTALGREAAQRDRAARALCGAVPGPQRGRAHARRQIRLAFVQVPPRGLWGRSAQVRSTTAESWLGRPFAADPSIDAVVLRYLAAFGPASVADVTTWCRLTGLRAVVERLRPQLVTFRDERGRELFDLPDAPRPGPGHACARALPARSTTTSCSRTTTAAASSCREGREALRASGRSARAPCSPTGSSARVWRLEPDASRRQPRRPAAEAAARRRSRRKAGGWRGSSRAAPDCAPDRAQSVRPAPRRVSASAPRSDGERRAHPSRPSPWRART